MSADNVSNVNTVDNKTQNPCRRKRSNSLDSRRNRHFILESNNISSGIEKYSSSGNLVEANIFTNLSIHELLFAHWYNNSKILKGMLLELHQYDIFKTGFPILEKKFPQIMFLVTSNLKVENDYEIYTINNYDLKISAFTKWSMIEKTEDFDEYKKGLKNINQKSDEISKTNFNQEDNEIMDEEMKKNRRNSETMALMIVSKNQQISNFLPNKSSYNKDSYDIINKVEEVFLIDSTRKTDKNLRHVILSNEVILIFATKKTERLKYKFFLKHLYCETCNDYQIPNIDSSLRIGGPFGDDLVITFSNPKCRIEWNNAIKKSILIYLESLKSQTADITIWKNLELNSSAPLGSKMFNINEKTTGLELRKKAIEGFNQNDKSVNDFILTFNSTGSNREYILNDDVIVMILQEHIGCFGDVNSCSECCCNAGNKILLNRIHFYLKYNPLRDIVKVKKLKQNVDIKTNKTRQYCLNEKWPDKIIPQWLVVLFADIYYEGSETEGIFRKSSVKSKSDDIIYKICEGAEDMEFTDEIHSKANILKKFLLAIEGSIFTSANKEKLIALGNEITSFEDFSKKDEQINKVLNIVQSLPQNNYNLLQMLLVVINQVCKNEAVNKMSLSNLSVCIGPSVLTEMNKITQEDYFKINTVFECICSLFNKIVDNTSNISILTSFNKRRVSNESSSITTSADEVSSKGTVDVINSSSELLPNNDITRTSATLISSQQKIKDINKNDFMDSDPILYKNNLQSKKLTLQYMRNSYSEELASDQVDSGFDLLKPKPDISNQLHKSKGLRKKRSSTERHTIKFTDDKQSKNELKSKTDKKTSESVQSSPFCRQKNVNRKHRDHSLSNCRINLDEQKVTDLIQEAVKKEQPELYIKLVRNPEKTIFDKHLRSRDCMKQEKKTVTSEQPNDTFTFSPMYDSKEVSNDELIAVKTFKQGIETNLNETSYANRITVLPLNNEIKDLEIDNRITGKGNLSTKKQNMNINITGPIRPTYPTSYKISPIPFQSTECIKPELKEAMEKVEDSNVIFL